MMEAASGSRGTTLPTGKRPELCLLGHREGVTAQVEGAAREPRSSGGEGKAGTKPCAGSLYSHRISGASHQKGQMWVPQPATGV